MSTFAQRYPWYMTPETRQSLIERSQAHRRQARLKRELAAVAARFEGSVGNVVPFPGRVL